MEKSNTNGTSWIYSYFKTHDRVSKFREDLWYVLKYPASYHPALVSIADSFHNKNKISKKQLDYALALLQNYRQATRVALRKE